MSITKVYSVANDDIRENDDRNDGRPFEIARVILFLETVVQCHQAQTPRFGGRTGDLTRNGGTTPGSRPVGGVTPRNPRSRSIEPDFTAPPYYGMPSEPRGGPTSPLWPGPLGPPVLPTPTPGEPDFCAGFVGVRVHLIGVPTFGRPEAHNTRAELVELVDTNATGAASEVVPATRGLDRIGVIDLGPVPCSGGFRFGVVEVHQTPGGFSPNNDFLGFLATEKFIRGTVDWAVSVTECGVIQAQSVSLRWQPRPGPQYRLYPALEVGALESPGGYSPPIR